MAFTEFYCNHNTGSNLNAGSTEGDPVATLTGGDWVQSTRVFTKAGANLSGVSVGMFASVYADGASAPTGFIGRITAVDDTADTITIDGTAITGTAPTDGTANRTLVVGGVWKGPNGASGFPFSVDGTLRNASGDLMRVNLKNNETYSITARVSRQPSGTGSPTAGPAVFEGYTTTAGDGGKFTLDGGTSGASYTLLDIDSNTRGCVLRSVILQNNGASGSASGLSINASAQAVWIDKVVVHDVRGNGIANASTTCLITECEAYACNQSNTANVSGISFGTGIAAVRCISHHNTGSNAVGFHAGGNNTTAVVCECIAHANGSHGFRQAGGSSNNKISYQQCDSYDNGGSGLLIDGSGTVGLVQIENSNFLSNDVYGIGVNTTDRAIVLIRNCGFGAGTKANASGDIQTASLTGLVMGIIEGKVTYAADVTPWVDPDDGDFRINLAAAKGAGRGAFTQTQSGYGAPNATVAYPDIGAGQHQDSGGGGGAAMLVNSGGLVG